MKFRKKREREGGQEELLFVSVEYAAAIM